MKTVRTVIIIFLSLLGALSFFVSSCNAQLNGNFKRVRLVPSTDESGTNARNGSMIYNSASNSFRFYQNGAWLNLIPQQQTITGYQFLGSTIKAQSLPVESTGTATNMTGAREQFVAVYIPTGTLITGVKWFQTVSGNYTPADSNKVALYTYSGGTLTKVAESNSDGNLWVGTGIKSKAFRTAYTTTTSAVYYVCLLYNRSAQVTAPAVSSGVAFTVNPALDFTNSAKLYSYVDAKTNVDNTIVSSSLTINQTPFWVAVY